MPDIRAIETEYNGYKFRSRLEARWAVFLDTLGIRYVYEPEGFELGDGLRYLPDFWLTDLRSWIEVKPTYPTDEERDKGRRLAVGSGFPLFFLVGVPAEYKTVVRRYASGMTENVVFEGSHLYVFPDGDMDGQIGWGECGCCVPPGRIDLGLDGEDFEREHHAGYGMGTHTGIRPDGGRLTRAYRAARQARFEKYPPNMRRILEDSGLVR